MPIENGKYVKPNWRNGGSPAINAAELNDMSTALAQVYPRVATLLVQTHNTNISVSVSATGVTTQTKSTGSGKSVTFDLPDLADYTVTATIDGTLYTKSVSIKAYTSYKIAMDESYVPSSGQGLVYSTDSTRMQCIVYRGNGVSSGGRTFFFGFTPRVVFFSRIGGTFHTQNETFCLAKGATSQIIGTNVWNVDWGDEDNSVSWTCSKYGQSILTARNAFNDASELYSITAIG